MLNLSVTVKIFGRVYGTPVSRPGTVAPCGNDEFKINLHSVSLHSMKEFKAAFEEYCQTPIVYPTTGEEMKGRHFFEPDFSVLDENGKETLNGGFSGFVGAEESEAVMWAIFGGLSKSYGGFAYIRRTKRDRLYL